MEGEITRLVRLRRIPSVLSGYGWLMLLVVALLMLRHEWGGFHLSELDIALARIGVWHLLAALGFTLLSLLCNASLDLVALHWVGRRLPVAGVIGTGLIASSFSMNGGGTILGGGSIRLRYYGREGLDGGDVAKITGFLMAAGWMGHALLAGVLMLWSPPPLPWLPEWSGRMVGLVLLSGCAVPFVLSALCQRGRWKPLLPPWRVLAVAMLVSGLDWLLAGLALRVLLPAEVPTVMFLALTALGQALGAASHVPGGVGVLELSVSKLAAAIAPSAMIAGALLTYRLVYYLLPFLLAVGGIALREVWVRRHWARPALQGTARVLPALIPRIAGISALAGGFVLMLSATTPMEDQRREWLQDVMPLPFVEASHFLSSIAGTVMVIVANGLLRRVRAAWWSAVLMAGGGAVFSLCKGFDWEETIVLAVFLAALLPFRSSFHRHAAIWSRRFSFQWWALILAIVLLAVWFGFYTTRHVEYQSELWWMFSFAGDASRLLRGLAGSSLLLVFVGLSQWLRPAPAQGFVPEPPMDSITEMVAASPRCASALALAGDKRFMFNHDRDAFLMYGDHGRTRVALAEPVGNPEKFDGLYWRFVERCQDEGMRAAFYQVSAEMVPTCVEMGLRVFKLGEEALIPLDKFDLTLPENKKFRKVLNRMEREHWRFEIWQSDEVVRRMNELRVISDAWLVHHSAKEKGFSLGFFNEEYLRRLPVAVLMVEGMVKAFVNIWPGNGRDEISTDLMRHLPDAPNGTMDCLFVNLMLWGREQGYRWFDLGMAPLSGLESRRFAPLWNRIGGLIYDHGKAFYNFSGLRAWKEKFQPVWRPRYLAVPKSWDLPAAILDITALISRSAARASESSSTEQESSPTQIS